MFYLFDEDVVVRHCAEECVCMCVCVCVGGGGGGRGRGVGDPP